MTGDIIQNPGRKKISFLLLIAGAFLILSSGCVSSENSSLNDYRGISPEDVIAGSDVDYADSYNWLSLPEAEKEVDVFYVYPTVSSNASGSMLICDDVDRALAQGILKAQAGVYESSANVFAPYYRQMSTGVTMTDTGLATDTDE
ncbi:MAG: DUF3089 domain-containing protein, partial [Methanomicrobium sp.]|nr:DUF3089 domain-containing protein [Methanomicrobium sp.]